LLFSPSSSTFIEANPFILLILPVQRLVEILDLSDNVLVHGTLLDFAHNGFLRTLVLSGTTFSGTLLDSIGNLTKLSENRSFKLQFQLINAMLNGKAYPIALFGHVIQQFHRTNSIIQLSQEFDPNKPISK
jgi:hypothetical protein